MSRQYDNSGRDQLNIENNYNQVVIQSREQSVRSQDELRLLNEVRAQVEKDLRDSLHKTVFLNLSKEAQPKLIRRLRAIKIVVEVKVEIPTTDDKPIAEVFRLPEIKGRLLILGKPGSGKTTTMLDLAKALLEKADEDSSYPIPVVFNLSSWQDEKQLIQDWLVMELQSVSKYGFPAKVARRLVAEQVILPLLDGLDEVAPERQEKCVQQINAYLAGESSPLYVVVCSRVEEYKAATRKEPLRLRGAVELKELSNGQIQEYLMKAERKDLWQFISQSPNLMNLVCTPLFLNMAVLTYPQGSTKQWESFQTANNQLQHLLNDYVAKMLSKTKSDEDFKSLAYGKCKVPSEEQTRRWLVWLAILMKATSRTEFLIEEIQPFMLSDGVRKKYQLIFRLIWGLIWGVFFLLVKGSIAWLIGGLIFGLILGMAEEAHSKIEPVEVFRWSWVGLVKDRSFLGQILMILGMIFGLTRVQIEWAIFGIVFGLIGGLVGETLDVKTTPNQGIKRSAINCLSIWLIFGLIFGLTKGLLRGETGWLEILLLVGVTWGLKSGGAACIQHLALRLLLHQSKLIPWNYARFLDYSTELRILQRVGGRYLFIHKLLQEYFAGMPVTR